MKNSSNCNSNSNNSSSSIIRRDYDEKMREPMFPRLNVNDAADKGGRGPKPPPRNKMALYEQLSIPSQRLIKPEVLPSSTNIRNFHAPGSSPQSGGLDRNLSFPHRVLATRPTNLAEKYHVTNSDRTNTKTPLAHLEEKRKKVGDEDDFTVPVFVYSETSHWSKTHNNAEKEKRIPPSSTSSGHSIIKPKFSQDPKKISHISPRSIKDGKNQSEGVFKASVSKNMEYYVEATSKLTNEKTIAREKVADTRTRQKRSGVFSFTRFHNEASCLRQDSRENSLSNTARRCEVVRSGDKACDPFQLRNEEKSDDISENYIVDSIFGTVIYPDDVVGMIGQKQFWNARKSIANQQRVFAVQLFELHRLIKVQRLVAGSPHILLENLDKPTLKSAPVHKASTEYIVKPMPRIFKRKDDSEKPSQKTEWSAENTVQKTSFTADRNDTPPSTRGSYPVPLPQSQSPVVMPGQQWLIPVMSPSEGLVYKPFGGHGFPGSFPPGPFGATPMMGNNFMNLPYGIPANHNHPGAEILPGHGYFNPYSMEVMNPIISNSSVEQTFQKPGPASHGQAGQLFGAGAKSSMQNESSCNIPTRKNRPVTQAVKYQASRDTELQGSSASCPSVRVQGGEVAPTNETRDARPTWPVLPAAFMDGVSQPHQPTRVIKTVPHNPRLAYESTARIFRSLQAERKRFDSSKGVFGKTLEG